jgi:hypothetical protein
LKALVEVLGSRALLFAAGLLTIFHCQFHLFRRSNFPLLLGAHKKLLEFLPALVRASRSARLNCAGFGLFYRPYMFFTFA